MSTVGYAVISQTAASATLVAAPSDPVQRIRVLGYVVAMAASGTFTFKSATTALTGAMGPFNAGGGVSAAPGKQAHFICAAGAALVLTLDAGGATGHLVYEIA